MTDFWHIGPFTELTPQELYAILQLRQAIFVVEQSCAYLDLDGLDQQAMHMRCSRDDNILAYQRCLAPGVVYPESSLGRILVCPSQRGRQLGRDLVQRGINFNRQQWPHKDILINAQAHLQGFYNSLGFMPEGDTHVEDGIVHRHMRFQIP